MVKTPNLITLNAALHLSVSPFKIEMFKFSITDSLYKRMSFYCKVRK